MNAEQKAINEWFESNDGKCLLDPVSLKAPAQSAEYLRNRLWTAFTAGMGEGRRIERERVLESIRAVLKL